MEQGKLRIPILGLWLRLDFILCRIPCLQRLPEKTKKHSGKRPSISPDQVAGGDPGRRQKIENYYRVGKEDLLIASNKVYFSDIKLKIAGLAPLSWRGKVS